MKFFEKNTNLIIDALLNIGYNEEHLRFPVGIYLVKITDNSIHKVTVFFMTRNGQPSIDVNEKPVTEPIEMWDEYYENKELKEGQYITHYVGENMYKALLEDCQNCYEKNYAGN